MLPNVSQNSNPNFISQEIINERSHSQLLKRENPKKGGFDYFKKSKKTGGARNSMAENERPPEFSGTFYVADDHSNSGGTGSRTKEKRKSFLGNIFKKT